jgi:invasion protein IalB
MLESLRNRQQDETMLRLTTLVAAAVLAGLTTPVWAQDSEAPATEAPAAEAPASDAPAEDAPADAGAADTQFDLGAPADATAPQPGQPYIRDTFGDWALRCLLAPEGPDPCQMYQLLLNDDQTPVAEISVVPLAPGGAAEAGVIVVVPLETQLTEQLTLAIDGGEARRYPFDFCNAAGCIARFGLSPEQVAQFKRGSSGEPVHRARRRTGSAHHADHVADRLTAGFEATTTEPE